MSDLFDLLIRSTRLALFETDYDDWRYASHGGTIFVVALHGKPYALTARHIAGDFPWRSLCVTNEKHGSKIAGLKSINYPSSLRKAAVGTDIADIGVIEFAQDISVEFFGEDIYPLSVTSVARSQAGDDLTIYGALKEGLIIQDRIIQPTFAKLGFLDEGWHATDPFLRACSAYWRDPGFTTITGLSGSPVFNDTRDRLAGVMFRGNLSSDGSARGYYLDIEDVVRVLSVVHSGSMGADYMKVVALTDRATRSTDTNAGS